ncbi:MULTISPECIES: chorismate mutase [Microbacterium]|uniref:chorismate mutase n=1 Tax=Microbacterium TaxID=33882 RepID=UPI0012B77E14|nr:MULTISPECIES: chorismate mutase [Microbacterium]MTE24194.1 chorismate mutase [Microbacterium sp. ZXX196]NHI15935.1 chorismate mutase [Microbacterium excoecariae]
MSETPDETMATLLRLRASIDNIDAALVFMLAERFRCTKQVGELKATHDLPASDPAREERQIARLRELADEADLDPEFAHKWFRFVVAEVIQHHKQAAGEA